MSVKTSDADRAPEAEGLNVTLTVQLLPATTFCPVHVSALLLKSPAFVPLITTEEMLRAPVPALVIVSVSAELVVLTTMEPKLRPVEGLSCERGTAAASIPTTNVMTFSVAEIDQLTVC